MDSNSPPSDRSTDSFDDRIDDGTLSLPGLPASIGKLLFDVVTWSEVSAK